MVNSYSKALIDYVPVFNVRERLEYLNLEITQKQMNHAIRYLSTPKINTQPLNLSDRNVTYIESFLEAFSIEAVPFGKCWFAFG